LPTAKNWSKRVFEIASNFSEEYAEIKPAIEQNLSILLRLVFSKGDKNAIKELYGGGNPKLPDIFFNDIG